jgi:predicted amidophosphoribosyltransferase
VFGCGVRAKLSGVPFGVATLLREALALAVPPTCAACPAPLIAAGDPLCAECRRALPWLRGPRCPRCALGDHHGGRCPAALAPWSAAWAPMAHTGPARALVAGMKFRGALGLADLMAAAMAAAPPPGLLAGAVLVPVPVPASRRRARGFDHADLIARALARRTGLPLRRALERRGTAARQLGAPRGERMAAGRFDVRARGSIPAVALLVDDVHTTGATLAACARSLRASGSAEVRAITYARAGASPTIRPSPLRTPTRGS